MLKMYLLILFSPQNDIFNFFLLKMSLQKRRGAPYNNLGDSDDFLGFWAPIY